MKQETKNRPARSKLGLVEEKIGDKKLRKMKDETGVSNQKCPYCNSTNLEEDESMVRCLDCGMGNYKKGKHKGTR